MLIEKLSIKYAHCLERTAKKIKKGIQRKRKERFVKDFGLRELNNSIKKDIRYNSYEGTNLYLIDELIKEEIIKHDDKIVDIGCGTGIFLLYLSHLGFDKLVGLEYDAELYKVCIENLNQYKATQARVVNIEVYNQNALEYNYAPDCTCFYLFNTFYDKDTYDKWIDKVENSIKSNPRNVRIIILYPTVASMGSMRSRKWIKEKCRIMCKAQYCYNCMYFIVYEGGENIEDLDDLNCK